jgi:hypothetical protein
VADAENTWFDKTTPLIRGGFIEIAREVVYRYALTHLEKTDERHKTFAIDEVYVVWFAKTLQNWKALISTTLPDGMYYEVTFNGDADLIYLDAYKKFENTKIPLDSIHH